MFGKVKKEKDKKEEKRFYVKYSQDDFLCAIQIIVDRETGVNYLTTYENKFFVPLLDENGKVVVDKIEKEEEPIW